MTNYTLFTVRRDSLTRHSVANSLSDLLATRPWTGVTSVVWNVIATLYTLHHDVANQRGRNDSLLLYCVALPIRGHSTHCPRPSVNFVPFHALG